MVTKTTAVLNNGEGRRGGNKQRPLAWWYSTVADDAVVLDKKRRGGTQWRRTRWCWMTATGAAVLNNGHRPMLSNDGHDRTWMECLPCWMSENNLCGGGRQRVFILPAKKQLADSQEVVPNTWDTIRQKRQICECASCEKKKTIKDTDSQTRSLQI